MARYPKELIGIKFERLAPIEVVGKNKHDSLMWRCLCDCGGTIITSRNHLTAGDTKSCGCLNNETRSKMCILRNTTHKMSKTRIYNQWVLMRRRCLDDPTKNPDYENYAGRGITYDPAWSDFGVFYNDMGDCPEGLELDRINNELGYFKNNCKWSSRTEQNRNTRRNRYYIIDGKKMSLSEIAEASNINYNTLRSRVYILKMTINEALDHVKYQKYKQ